MKRATPTPASGPPARRRAGFAGASIGWRIDGPAAGIGRLRGEGADYGRAVAAGAAPAAGVNASEKQASSCRPCETNAGRAASTMRTEPQA